MDANKLQELGIRIYGFLKEKEFVKYTTEHGVYVRRNRSELLILFLYVDNLLITDNCKKEIKDFKCALVSLAYQP